MSSQLAEAAEIGFHDAGAYDAHRPSYLPAVVDGLLHQLEVPRPATQEVRIVEIAAGTGKFTQALSRLAASSSLPWSITAVEPHDQMRAQLVAKSLPHIAVVKGHAAGVPAVPDGWADAVITAQAFHWWVSLFIYLFIFLLVVSSLVLS